MAKYQPFLVPAGVKLSYSTKGVSIEHSGDIILHVPVGEKMDKVVSLEGSVTLRGDFSMNQIAAAGKVRLEGRISSGSIKGEHVEVVTRSLEVVSIQATKKISIAETTIKADVIIAPTIDISPTANGRCPIIESHNSCGPNAIKGGFSVSEYDELIGNVNEYLSSRGVSPLAESKAAAIEEEEEDDESFVPAVALEAEEADFDLDAFEEHQDDPDTLTEASQIRVGIQTAKENLEEDDEDEDEFPALEEVSSLEDEFEVIPELEEDDDHIYTELKGILETLSSCYEDGEPEVITNIREMVENRNYSEIQNQLPQLWNDLVKYHRDRGIRIKRQVTSTFNNIMSVVKNSPSVTIGS